MFKIGLILFVVTHSFAEEYNHRPKLESISGNLFIQVSEGKEINFVTSGKGRLLFNRYDIGQLFESSKTSSDTLNQCKANVETSLNKIQKIEQTFYGHQGLLQRIETLEKNNTNSTTARRTRLILNLVKRRVNNLQKKINLIITLLAQNECASNPCLNGGTCEDMYNAFRCRCTDQWEGPRCDKDVNECSWFAGTELGCQNGATCINTIGSYECKCAVGWFGLHCTKRSQDCTSGREICGHGTCISQNTGIGYTCICDQGYKTDGVKPACTVDIDECKLYHPPCSVNPPVKCINIPGAFYCGECPIGYSGNGFYCSDIDECSVFNGGCSLNPHVECINTPGSRICGPCPPGYIGNGVTCTYQGGVCGVNNGGCHPSAQCRDNTRISNSYVECVCPRGFIGNGFGPNGCLKDAHDPCASSPCVHGTCTAGKDGGYVCNCNRRFTGTNCDIRKNACLSNPCQNGGTCNMVLFSYYCVCPSPFTGANCENELQVCGRKRGPSGVIKYPLTNVTVPTGRLNCAWVIQTKMDKVLNITIKDFNMTNCATNWLQINDGGDSSAHLIGRFCGSNAPSNFISTSHLLYLWFRYFIGPRPRIELTWNELDPVCGGLISVTKHGSFKSPGAPGVYPPNRDCYWRFIAPVGQRIQFHFFSLQIGFNKDCNSDYLEFRNGLEPTDPLIVQYCNTSHPEPLNSLGHEILAHFHSDDKGAFPGFQISFSIVAGVPGCGGIFSSKEGEIVSPSFNGKYPTNSVCEYKLKIPGARVKITFERFSLESSKNCEFDYLSIYDGGSVDSPIVGKYCGDVKPAPILSDGSNMLIVFKSDWSNESKGFKIKYETVCGGKFFMPNGTITSPEYPNLETVEKPTECIFEITRPLGSIIKLRFLDIGFGNDSTMANNCSNGYLEVRDGDNKNSTLLGRYCDKAPETLYSSFNYIWMKYVVFEGTVKGFHLNYTSLDNNGCGGILKSKIGSVESPNFAESSKYGLSCAWVLMAPVDYVVQITWVKFSLELSYNCNYDRVTVVDNGTVPASQMGVFCGSKIPPTLVSSSNIVTVFYKIDNSHNLDGFLFTYHFIHEKNMCGGKYFTSSGVLKSPQYPESYPANRDCVWVITVPPGQQVMLNVTAFEIETYLNCRYDYLEIRNGGTAASPLIGKFCGTKIPKLIPSHANQLYLRFRSDMTKTAPGFKIIWNSASTGCGGTLTSSSGSIISPQYPEPYSKNTECFWKISVSAGSIVQIVFADIDLEPHIHCVLDYIEIFDGVGSNAKSMGKFCTSETNLPPYLRSTSNHMTIKFRSDLSFQGRGFQLQYSSVCNNVLKGFMGAIESPNYPNPYLNKHECLWEIEVSEGNKINITFSHFDIAVSPWQTNCSNSDYLQIKYLDPSEETMYDYGTYCGKELPEDIQINSHSAQIKLMVSNAVLSTGFRLEWHIVGCGGLLTHPNGTIQTPGYPTVYPISTICDWIIKTSYGSSVEIILHDIDLERSSDCMYDYITFYNGLDDTYPQITKLCHVPSEPITVTSTGNIMFVRFHSDSSYRGKGFSANYTTIPSKCGGKLTAPHGTIHSPNYPQNFDKNDTCGWLISIAENHIIELDFEDFDMVNLCNSYYVKVYDGPTQAYPVLAKLCGNKKPNATIVSSTNHLYIEMVTFSFLTSKGFRASYRTACGAEITTGGSGLISYSHNTQVLNTERCTWTIRADRPDKHIYLTVTHLESSSTGLVIYDGENNNSTVIGDYSGTKIPPTIRSGGSVLHLEILDLEHTFSAKYSTLDSTCGGTLESESGLFSSPNYPNNYPVDIQCEWSIKNSPGNKISISFTAMDISFSENCNEDYLEIRENDGGGKLLGIYCGTTIPTNITMGTDVWMLFKSDKSEPGEPATTSKGFLAEYYLQYGNELTGPSGKIASPMYPKLFKRYGEFMHRITVNAGYQISIKFLDFNMESYDETSCIFTQLIIYDGYDDTAPVLGTYCGYSLPETVKTTSNVAYIKTTYDQLRLGSKMLLEWLEVKSLPAKTPSTPRPNLPGGCGSIDPIVLGDKEHYNITSPGFPNPYPPSLTCTWYFSTTSDNHLSIRFHKIDFNAGIPCIVSDSIYIYTGKKGTSDFKLVEKVCNSNATMKRSIDTSNFMMVMFKSLSWSSNATGFSGYVATACGGSLTQPSGIIQVTNSTEFTIDSTLECVWNVTVRPGKTIKVEFLEIHLGENAQSCKNYVLLKNGQYSDSPILGNGKYCGNQKPQPLETTGNFLFVKYFSLSTLTNFKLKYSEVSINCGGKIMLSFSDNSTIINSPNYPNIPSPHTECIWTIIAPAGESVRIDFLERFDLIESEDCVYESVEIRNGGTKLSPLLGKYCSEFPPSHVSLENMMYIKFITDIDDPKNGFKARVSIATCGGIVRGSSGEIMSPGYNFPKMYPTQPGQCKWSIIGPRDHYLILDFKTIDLPFTLYPNCSKVDNVLITELNKMNNTEIEIGRYCGATPITNIRSSGNEVFVYFNILGRYRILNGFRLAFNTSQEECGGTINSESGVITSPGYPIMNHFNRNCEWFIRVPKGRRIKIDIEDFDFDKTIGLFFQGLAFFHGEDVTSHIIYLKAEDNTKVIRSSDNIMKIFFWSTHTSTHRGFKARFSSDEPTICIGDLNQDSGVITNPNGTAYKCTWVRDVVKPQAFETVALSINAIVTKPSYLTHSSCSYGFPTISIFLGNDKSNEIELCKTTTHPYIVRSPLPKVTLSATYSKVIYSMNFTISYKTYPCGGELKDGMGIIKSPGFPNNDSDQNMECAWLIRGTDDQTLLLKFDNFELGENCELNYLVVYNGDNLKAPKIGKFCGNHKPGNIQSQSKSLLLEYHYEKNRGIGFNASYEPVTKGCGGIFHSPTSMLATPEYPKDYPNNAECLWELRAKNGYHINLEFINRFQIEQSDKCKNDFVEIYNAFDDENRTDIAKYCGREIPPSLNSTSNKLFVLFRSNDRTTGVGFRAKWKLLCGGNFAADETVRYLTSPGYPENYENELTCEYVITAPNRYITVNFEDFELEKGPYGCRFDSVKIIKHNSYRGLYKQNSIVYCGTNKPYKIRLKGAVTILFKSDKWIRKRGFKLNYYVDRCGGTITKPTVIGSVIEKALHYFEGDTKCIWNVTAPADQRITVKFLEVSMSNSFNCGNHYVSIADSTGKLATVCGELLEDLPVIHSNNNNLIITYFYTRFSYRNTNFSAAIYFTYGPSAGCGGEIDLVNTTSKTIETPSKLDNFDCIWRFTAKADFTIKIEILEMHYMSCDPNNIEANRNNCSCVLYELRDGYTSNSEIINSVCDSELDTTATFFSSNQYAWMRIASHTKLKKPSKFRFTAIPSICGPLTLLATETPKYLISPNFPQEYPKDIRCVWKITGKEYKKTLIRFVDFDINNDIENSNTSDAHCGERDRLEIQDLDNHRDFNFNYDMIYNDKPNLMQLVNFNALIGAYTFCNKNDKNYEYLSSRNKVQVKFISSRKDKHGKGFKLEYQVANCNRNYTTLQGRLTKTWYAGNCSIYIKVPENYTISLYFDYFSTMFADCSKNGLQIFDGDVTKQKLLEVCETIVPKPVFSSSNQVYLKLYSKFMFGHNNFDILYTASKEGRGCGGDMYSLKGFFSSPFYPATYTNDSTCTWSVKVPMGLEVSFWFTFFDVQGKCSTNYVTVTTYVEGQSNVHRFCKGMKPAVLYSNSKLLVQYKTAKDNVGTGWFAKFVAITPAISKTAFTSEINATIKNKK